ncbi:MAG: hypothetical protein KDA76_12090 [Planctomycetaceae bacterium]|nr:hypothetical protein [Planctomycetaceae bacterium]
MRIQIESTNEITTLDGVPCRVWRGTTESGIDCFVFVHRLAVHSEKAYEFDCELREMAPPSTPTLPAILGGQG